VGGQANGALARMKVGLVGVGLGLFALGAQAWAAAGPFPTGAAPPPAAGATLEFPDWRQQQQDSGSAVTGSAMAESGTDFASQDGPRPGDERLKQWLEDLQSEHFSRRLEASQGLAEAEFAVVPRLIPLLTAPQAEVAWRARQVLLRQGIRGGDLEVRRIGLILHLLTAAGHPQFASDARDFQQRVQSTRIAELVRQIEREEGMDIFEGYRMAGGAIEMRGEVVIAQGGRIIRLIPPAERAPIPDDWQLLQPPANQGAAGWRQRDERSRRSAEDRRQDDAELEGDEADDETDSQEGPPPESEEQRQRREVLENLDTWLERIAVAEHAQLETWETQWSKIGLIADSSSASTPGFVNYELIVQSDLVPRQMDLIRRLAANHLGISLQLNEIEVTADWVALIAEAHRQSRLTQVMTYKCRLDMEVYRQLLALAKGSPALNWETQGRAMLGIMDGAPQLAFDRLHPAATDGAVVGRVTPDSAAERGGLQSNDLITHVQGVRVENFTELRRLVAVFDVDQEIEVRVRRDGQPEPLTLKFRLMRHTQ